MRKATGVTGAPENGIVTEDLSRRWCARQELAVQRILAHFALHGFDAPYPLLSAATGFGKGRVIAEIIKRVAEILGHAHHDPTLLIAGSKDLLREQAVSAIGGHLEEEETGPGRFAFLGGKVSPDADILVTIWQTLLARAKRGLLPKVGVTVIDEAHNAGVQARLDLLKQLETDAVVGLTATAVRSSGAYRTPEAYGFEVVDTIPLTEGIHEGWNSPLIGIPIDPGFTLPADVREGENLNHAKLARELRKHPEYLPNVTRLLAEVFLKGSNGSPGPKAVIPVNRVDQEAVVIARILKEYGYTVGLAVNTSASRKWAGEFPTFDAVERHKLPHDDPNAIQVLISPHVIGEGYDNPAVELIAWVVPTISALRYTQVLGRGTRICPGKAYCLVVDFPWFIEGFGYSTTLGQFFLKEDIQELEDGRYFIGPKGSWLPNLPSMPSLEQYGKLVTLPDLERVVYPEAGDWLTANKIRIKLRRSFHYTIERLQAYSAAAELRREAQSGKIVLHYPPSIVARLQQGEIEASHTWKTARQISTELGISEFRVHEALKRLKPVHEIRCNELGRKRIHYPPSTITTIKDECAGEDVTGWVTVNELTCLLPRRGRKWIVNRIAGLRCESRLGRGKANRLLPHFPPEIINQLLEADQLDTRHLK